MSNVFSIIASSLQNDAAAVGLVAQNVANASNVAYRSEYAIAHEALAASATGSGHSAAPRTATVVDTRPGTFKSTGEPLHLAIQGNAYFVVNTATGEALTRRGDFHTDANGVLCAFSGDPVQGTLGTITLGSGTPPQIDASGAIHVGSETVGSLRLVELAPGATLEPIGNGLFASRGAAVETTQSAQVRQGFLETSNVSPVGEMLHLLETMRHFEAGQRFARAYDEMMDRAISDMGKS